MYAAGFGLPAVPIAVIAVRERALPWFLDLFPMFGGPWSNAGRWTAFAWLLVAFLGVTLAATFAGVLLWRGRRSGAILTFALMPVEAIFWWGFALPFPPLIGVVRVALAAVAWGRLAR
ncbi:hypothetical protein ACLQ2Q_07375 [Microbacterium sp. DT81.1]|uniref:hypothetical protein n=1 Tax=Microbacterium sp. DT81.1 TaxID=3393413 RepID=UPI003CF78520